MIELDEKYFQKLDRELTLIPLTYDFAFKRMFRGNLDILRKFLKVVVPLKIDEDAIIRLMNSELPKDNKKEYQKTVDIYVVLDHKIYVDIEMNRSLFNDVKERNKQYLNKLSTLLLESGEDYKKLNDKSLYQLNLNANEKENEYGDDIVVLYAVKSKRFFAPNEAMVIKDLEYFRKLYYTLGDKKEEVIWLTALTSKTFEELYSLIKQVLEGEELRRFMEGAIDMSKDEFILHEWQKDKLDALVRHNELERAKNEGLLEGKSSGFEEGKAIGFADGKNSGFEEGKDAGINENKIETAKKLLNENIDIKLISKVTGLTKLEIEKMQE